MEDKTRKTVCEKFPNFGNQDRKIIEFQENFCILDKQEKISCKMTSLMSSKEGGASGDGQPGVELTVKSANQSFDDLIVQCDNVWSVKKLKERITEQYPCKLVSFSDCISFLILSVVLRDIK